jgi:hypothetical protein
MLPSMLPSMPPSPPAITTPSATDVAASASVSDRQVGTRDVDVCTDVGAVNGELVGLV